MSLYLNLKTITIFLLLWIVIVSIFAARWSNLITVIPHPPLNLKSNTTSSSRSGLNEVHYKSKDKDMNNIVVGNQFQHLIWFVQISDIHISIFHDQGRIRDLTSFCHSTIDAIRPAVVLASGDLADGKAIDNMGSDQFIQEWITYKNILDESGVLNKTIWLDIRGNHDNFNVPGAGSDRSYYHRYSVQGQKHLRSYMHTLKVGPDKNTGENLEETYSFIAVDACLEPGPKRPFNFIGSITDDQFALLESFEAQSHSSTGTIWFGHYPTSCILSPKPGIRTLMQSATAYLCGHLHTLGGVVPQMYTKQHSGVLELELGDWKDNRIYRLAAFDHGMFSFIDVEHGKWPVILVTNPKNALFLLPHKEPLNLMTLSTHIRILAFSTHPIESVRIRIDDSDTWETAQFVQGPLWTVAWNTTKVSTGLHTMQVIARDLAGNQHEINHPFSLDGTTLSFRLLPRIVLMTDASSVFYGVFLSLVLLSVIPLIGTKVLHCLVKRNLVTKPKLHTPLLGSLLRKLWILSAINKLWIPIVGFPLYLTIGPWFIGEVIVGHIGASFAWGTVVNWTVLPTSFTYFYGTIQLLGFHIPFIVFLSFLAESKYGEVCCSHNSPKYSWWMTHGSLATILLLHGLFAYYFWLAYGTMALVLGPLRTWSWFMGLWLWWMAGWKLGKRSDFEELEWVWGRGGVRDHEDEQFCTNGDISHEN